jgi:hypothetical protein
MTKAYSDGRSKLEVKKSKISVVSCWLLVDGENSSVIFKENLLLKNNK